LFLLTEVFYLHESLPAEVVGTPLQHCPGDGLAETTRDKRQVLRGELIL
jgi:hypothetical protein